MIKNSSTILLPRWGQILEDLENNATLSGSEPLAIRIMPRDVATRWNSTFDMLTFALEYREAIDLISSDREMRKFELMDEEWLLVEQLCDVLGVRCALIAVLSLHSSSCHSQCLLDIQGGDPFLLTFDTESCHCDTGNGSHRRLPCHYKPRLEARACHSRFAGTRESPSKQILQHD
jgi:hypothetical protein